MLLPRALDYPAEHGQCLRKLPLDLQHWYAVSADDLKPGTMRQIVIDETKIVLAKTASNKLFALDDKCAHRQVPLSLGTVDGETLQCAYHGWRFSADGAPCLSVPAANDRFIRPVRSYPVMQKYGLVFLLPGARQNPSTTNFPIIPEADSSQYLRIVFEKSFACHYTFLHENLFDMSHQHLHRQWTGRFRPKYLSHHETSNSIEVQYSADLRDGSRYLRHLPPIVLGRRPAKPSVEGPMFARIVTEYPHQWLGLFARDADPPLMKLWLSYVPGRDRNRSTTACGVLLVKKPTIPFVLTVMRPVFLYFAGKILSEDQEILKLEQEAYDSQGNDQNQEIAEHVVALRQFLLRKVMLGRQG